METLVSYREMQVRFEAADRTPETVRVNQIPLRKYQAAFAVMDDEFALAAIAIDKPSEFVLDLAPASYEELATAVKEVNSAGFFVYASRRQADLLDKLGKLPPEVVRIATENGSKTTPRGLRPR